MKSGAVLAFASMLCPFLISCEVIRAQKRASAPPSEVDFNSVGAFEPKTSVDDPPTEKRFNNIRTLEGLPSSQLYPVMAMFANSLGVTCAHCHTESFEDESKPEKQIARQMIVMTRSINRAQFQGEPTVTCYTCHRGQTYPSSMPLIADAGWHSMLSPKAPAPPLPDSASVLARYQSVSGQHAGAALPRGKGEVRLIGGLDEELTGSFESDVDASGAVIRSQVRLPPPLAKAITQSRFGALNLEQMYGEMDVIERRTVEGADAIIVAAETEDGPPDRLAFDAASGLLLRIQRGISTPLGYVPEEMSFSDYQTVEGIPTPHTLRWARGDFMITLEFSEINR